MVFCTGPGQCMRFTIPMLDPDLTCDNGWVACEELASESCHGQRFRSTRLVTFSHGASGARREEAYFRGVQVVRLQRCSGPRKDLSTIYTADLGGLGYIQMAVF